MSVSLPESRFILGAKDPEMDMIEHDILLPLDYQYIYADIVGKRVHPSTAYEATTSGSSNDVFIECGGTDLEGLVIDHHRPGDPGFEKGPDEFFPASSVGQMLVKIVHDAGYDYGPIHSISKTLGMRLYPFDTIGKPHALFDSGSWCITHPHYLCDVPEKFVLQAAADYCLAAAYRGRCPGINVDALKEFQIRNIAQGTGSSYSEVHDAISLAEFLLDGEGIILGSQQKKVTDLTERNLGVGYSLPYLALKEAATMNGASYMVRHKFSEGARPTIMLNGDNSPEMVKQFLDLVKSFGSPQRGYAGVVLPS